MHIHVYKCTCLCTVNVLQLASVVHYTNCKAPVLERPAILPAVRKVLVDTLHFTSYINNPTDSLLTLHTFHWQLCHSTVILGASVIQQINRQGSAIIRRQYRHFWQPSTSMSSRSSPRTSSDGLVRLTGRLNDLA